MLTNAFKSRGLKSLVAGLVITAGIAATVTPASAQYRRHHHRGDRGAAVGAGIALGIIGLAAGAAIASENSRRYERYDDGYYPRRSYYGGGGYYAPAPRAYYYDEAPPRVYYQRPARNFYTPGSNMHDWD
ncbi:hypothetical protein [Phreatobacter stygius]|uniref:hypothetical protein n=1 Tax=Phreatobacter stygius TaxID=1940610 RepID=UPI001B8ABA08|nr:hypothetical protein [Phreatobacter stygius]